MNAAKLIRQLKRVDFHFEHDKLPVLGLGAIATLNFLLDEGLNDLDDYEKIRTLKEDLERER